MKSLTVNNSKAIHPLPLLGALLGILVLLTLIYVGVKQTALWFDYNKIVFNRLDIQIRWPSVHVEERPQVSPIVQMVIEHPVEVDTPIEEMVCDKFGTWDCQVALAVMNAESGGDCEAFNVNTNGTADIGLFQINSIHWDRFGGLHELTTCEGNLEAAYTIWEEQSWSPWVAYWNGNFMEFLR